MARSDDRRLLCVLDEKVEKPGVKLIWKRGVLFVDFIDDVELGLT